MRRRTKKQDNFYLAKTRRQWSQSPPPLEDRKALADFNAFDKIMRRRTGIPPRNGNEIPL